MGYNAGPSANNLTNATAIGYLASVSASNSLVLGSINGTNGATSNTSVGIGLTAPSASYALDVVGSIHATGSVISGSTTLTSDRRLKRNIVPLNGAIGKVMELLPYSYEKKATIASNNYDQKEMGFLAQDLRKVLPELVKESTDADKTLSVNYTALIPLLTKAIQEQVAEITDLKKANTVMAAQNAAMAAQLAEILSKLKMEKK